MANTIFKDKTLLITGGTGSFGHTVLKHFLTTDIGEIRIFSRDEKKQDDMRHELQANYPDYYNKVKFYIGDVRNIQSLRDVMPGVNFIFHAAALKQVPSCEFFPMEAVDLVMFAFEHANPGDLFIQKSDASTIGDLAKAVQQLFGDTGTRVIGTRHGEKLYETLMTKEERMRSEDMGNYYRVAADNRDLNYDKYFIKGQVHTQADEDYTSHNTRRLDVEGTIKKIMTTEYIQEALKEAGKA